VPFNLLRAKPSSTVNTLQPLRLRFVCCVRCTQTLVGQGCCTDDEKMQRELLVVQCGTRQRRQREAR
jgi:hypothetical protein